jgi:hypothetical protein
MRRAEFDRKSLLVMARVSSVGIVICLGKGVTLFAETRIFLLLMTNLMHFSHCVYCTPLHVSSNKCSSSGGSNCVKVGTQDSHPLECIVPDDVLTHFDPPDDEHLLHETCRGVQWRRWEKCIKLVINKNYVEMLHGQQNIKYKEFFSRRNLWDWYWGPPSILSKMRQLWRCRGLKLKPYLLAPRLSIRG